MEDIKRLISMGESHNLQFKREFIGQDRIADEIVAFANSKGGAIVIGVDDKTGEIVGLEYRDIQRISNEIGNAANEKIRPTIYVETSPQEIDGKYVLLTKVSEGISKPYKNLRGEIYVKQGVDKRRITENREILRLFHDSRQYFPDEEPVADTSVTDIYDKAIDRFLQRAYGKSRDEFGVTYEQLLKNLRILRPNGNLSLAGLLFFAEHPEYYMPQFIVKAVAFVGNSLGGTIYRDSRDIAGDLSYVFEECMKFCEGNLHHIQSNQSFNSLGILEVSRIALEELIQNALTHRSYLIDAPIRLLIFDDRIEIVSPGTLAGDLTVESIKLGEAYQRNPLLSSFCARGMNYRGLGSGILRAIQDGAKMSFKSDDLTQQFTATIYRENNISLQPIDNTSNEIISNRTNKEKSLEELALKYGLDATEFGLKVERIAKSCGLNPNLYGLKVIEYGLDSSKCGLDNQGCCLEPSKCGLGLNEVLILAMMYVMPSIKLKEISEAVNLSLRYVEKLVAGLKSKGLLKKVGGKRFGKWITIHNPKN